MIKTCKKHGDIKHYKRAGREDSWRCSQCSVEAVTERRRKVIRETIEYKGGKCQCCGYDKCVEALDFHHIDPTTKEFGISDGSTRSLEKTKAEADKCILLCANCHRELHAGMIQIE